ncbi:unnamed protein product [Adineta steineri]|uniref:Uncharacterized protein n=1 Tax=Adineta steineri TaxID=433720 RepID=A0A814MWM2_9BILA|nr:unnamed protein product [Adineta steineri]CAF1219055.1 unnamed protein product [Adineta steineri]
MHQCPVATNLKLYLIASGVLEIIWPVLFATIPFCDANAFDSVTKTYQKWKSENGGPWRKDGIKEETSYGIGVWTIIAACVCLFADFILWCCGNAWILTKYKYVEYHDSFSLSYCYASLFKAAFGIMIVTDIWCVFVCLALILYWMFK